MEINDLVKKLDSINEIVMKYENDYADILNKNQQIQKWDNEIKELETAIDQYENYKAEPNNLEQGVLNSKHGLIYKTIHNYFFILSIIWFIFIVIYGICYLFKVNILPIIMHDKQSVIISLIVFLGSPILFVPSSLKNDNKKYILKKLQERTDKFKKEYESVYQASLVKIAQLNVSKNLQKPLLIVLNTSISNYEKQLQEYIYLMPRKYITSQAINLFKEYIQYGRAFTIGECINIYEVEQSTVNAQKYYEDKIMSHEIN